MNKLRFFALIILMILSASSYRAQQTMLSADAEYNGALFDKSQPVVFHRNGRLASGTLKTSFVSGNFTFTAGKPISFYQDSSINTAELAGAVKIGDISFLPGKVVFHNNGKIQMAKAQAGSFHNNLKIPIDVEISLDKNGVITNINSSLTYFYQVLGMTVRGTGVELIYDEKTEEYKLLRGTNGAPQLAGVNDNQKSYSSATSFGSCCNAD